VTRLGSGRKVEERSRKFLEEENVPKKKLGGGNRKGRGSSPVKLESEAA